MKFLSIQNLDKVYALPKGGEYVALKDVNLEIRENEVVSIIGHSGCGKSTILSIVAGLQDATNGALLLENREIKGPGPDRAVVFQNHSLLPWLTVYQNIEIGVKKVMPELSKQERDERVMKFVNYVGLAPAVDKFPGEISGGMKQRVGIARALAIRPKVLLMDEPFGALDSLTRANLQDHLMRIQQSIKNTVVIITHDVDEAVLLSDRIIMMTNGPSATIGDIVEVNLPKPRNRLEVQDNPEYHRCKEAVMEFLYKKFAKEDE
jgi:nitrate/nitrite transport system ATP-binding protein